MKTKLILVMMFISSQTVWAQKIQVNGVIYDVDPMKTYPIHPSRIYTKNRSITPLISKKPIRF